MKSHFLKKILLFLLLLVVIAAAFFVYYNGHDSDKKAIDPSPSDTPSQAWTCSMHPQIRQPKFGRCPICAMDLIPLSAESDAPAALSELKLSESAIKLSEIETFPVSRKLAQVEIRMSGRVSFDESRVAYIAARFSGRIDKLFANYTGIAVKEGDPLAEVFSPELMVAQREVLLALKRDESSSQRTLNAVREKFRNWGFSPEQVDKIIQKGEVQDHLTINSPITGIVLEKNAFEGKNFEAGENLFTVSDLKHVWVILDAFETDIFGIRYGQKLRFSVEAYPGREFSGRIAFISPVLDEKSRTVKVRLNVQNEDEALKPGFFVRSALNVKLTDDGRIVEPFLSGKWISPTHPEIIKDKPGRCDVCGMELVPAESLGFAKAKIEKESLPLLIPASAPLITGRRAVVYVDKGSGIFEYREIELGPRAGDFYIVKSGLDEGEQVVVKGNFKIDSAMQILGKKSMISAFVNDLPADETHEREVKFPTDKVLESYFSVQKALAADDFALAVKHAAALDEFYSSYLASSADIKVARENFSRISSVLYNGILTDKSKIPKKVYRFYCPMAFNNKGAYWLQDDAKIANPYFGSAMLRCGELTEEIGSDIL